MKRFLLSMLMVVIGLSAFSQSPSRYISLRPSYPLVIGDSSIDNVAICNNGFYLHDIFLDSLPQYEIGYIDVQIVKYSDKGYGFYVKADSLHSVNVSYRCEVREQPNGTIEFNEQTGRFKYFSATDDYKRFYVTFTATNGTDSIFENVEFCPSPQTVSEAYAFSTEGTMPNNGDYITIAQTITTKYLNNEERPAYSISIVGKDVIFDNNIQNKVWGLSGRDDIYELNIYAERLIVRSALRFPQTDITIYAKELLFEDNGGEIASINTTPTSIETIANEAGCNGAKAGNITLFIKEFKSNMCQRFIMNGAKGQSTNRNAQPGKGGDGGTLTSTLDISGFCVFSKGAGGVGYDTSGAISSYGEMGKLGRLVLMDRPYAYLHPYFVSAVIRHANDAFINNRLEYALQACREYHAVLTEYLNLSASNTDEVGGWHEGIDSGEDLEALSPVRRKIDRSNDIVDLEALIHDADESSEDKQLLKCELQSNLLEIDNMLFKLEQGLDYFGNSPGWVPLLSFEVMLANYNNEIDRAIPTLYMYNWMNRIDLTLQNKVQACEFAANTTEQEIDANHEHYNKLVMEIPHLQDELEEIKAKIEDLTWRIEVLQQQLWAKAVKNVKKRNRLKRLFGIGKTIATVLPVLGPVGKAVGSAINATLDFASNSIGQVSFVDFSSQIAYLTNNTNGLANDLGKITNKNSSMTDILNSYSNIMTQAVTPLTNNINKLAQQLAKSSTPSSEVEAEYNMLVANSPEWNAMKAEFDELNQRKTELVNHINEVFSDMAQTSSELSNDILALDAFRRDAFIGNSKRDLNAMIYLAKMEQRAKSRLLLYDYYLRKAYEYRMLKPYTGEYNLVGMFNRFEAIAQAGDSIIDEHAYSTLSTVFRERISDMTQQIVDEYLITNPEKSAPITIVVPKEQLAALNADEDLTLNFHEMGIFSSAEENVRIVDLSIQHLDTHVEGNVGTSSYMDLIMSHSGISQFRKDGQIYWFDHMSRTSSNPHTWGIRYDAVSNERTAIQPSAASASLLSSIIGNDESIMSFSRPSAWSDITLSKNGFSSGGANIIVDSLVLRLQYDFTRHADNICNIDICASDGLMPYIACSKEDISGRSNGRGPLYRSFRTSSQPVTFSAVDKYGTYHFVNWTDRSGRIVSDKPELTVSQMKDQFYTANYERHIPILNVPDTIKVGHDGGTYTVHVSNSGIGDTEMDWYASDSLSTWVHLNDSSEGIDDGFFTFTFEANADNTLRIDSIEIFAPETDAMSKVIYIVQSIDISQYENVMYINSLEAFPGQKLVLPIMLKNNVDVAGVSFTLDLPDGVSLDKDEDGDIKYLLNESRAKSSRFSVYWAEGKDGNAGFRIMPNSTATISGTDGVLLKVTLKIDENMARGDYNILLRSNSITMKNSVGQLSTHYLPETESTLSVTNGILGDVNRDGRLDLTDAIMIVYSSLGVNQLSFAANAADVNGDGRIDLTDAIIVMYESLGVSSHHAPKVHTIEPE